MTLRDKISRYILNQPGVTSYKKNDSGSEYFRINEYLIRLSNHVTELHEIDVLNIIVNQNEITLIVKSKPYHINYETLKERIRNYVIFANMFRPVIIRKTVTSDKLNIKVDSKHRTLIYNNMVFKFKNLTNEQWNGLANQMKNYPPKSEVGFYNTIEQFKKL